MTHTDQRNHHSSSSEHQTDNDSEKDSNNLNETDFHAKDSPPSPTSNHSDSEHAQSHAPIKSPSPTKSKPPPPPPSPSTSPPPPSPSPPPPSPPPSPSPPPPSSSPPPPPSSSPPPHPSPSPPPPSPSPPHPSPSPPPPSPSPPPPPSLSPPPPPPSHSPPPLRNGKNNSQPPTTIPRKQSPPPLPVPSPVHRPSSPPVRSAPSTNLAPETTKSISRGSVSGSNHQAMNDGNVQPNSTGSAHSSSSGDDAGKYIGYSLAGAFIVALVAVAVAFVFVFKRKKARGDVYGSPYMPPLHVKSGADGRYYVQQPGPQPSLANNYRNGNVSMKHVGFPLESAKPKSAHIIFTYDTVMEITNAFSSQNVIGEGGFGRVYKGWLLDGKAVAVKQLKAGSGQGEREFRAEVEIISRVHHRHLVSLVGYCISEQQRVLIYEYVPNGTLHHHLHGIQMPVLDWAKRLKIAIGAAKGLAYLHEDCSQKIIHRDIKSANILLDDAYEAKVSDFGLARLADAANTHVSTRVMGTFGYMAPEYATSGKLTDRSDVFSFGVVLLELVTGRKPVDQNQPLGDESLVEWARPLLLRAIQTREFDQLIDPRLGKHFVESEMFRMIEAAAACVRHSAPRRPRMVQVLRALDGDEISDLSNGVKYGQSSVYDSRQYDRDIMLFRTMVDGSFFDSEFDMYSRGYRSARETSGRFQHSWLHSTSSSESETRAFNRHSSR